MTKLDRAQKRQISASLLAAPIQTAHRTTMVQKLFVL